MIATATPSRPSAEGDRARTQELAEVALVGDLGQFRKVIIMTKPYEFDIRTIAEVCHEANRVLTMAIGDDNVPVQPTWHSAPEDMKRSSMVGVHFSIDNPDATASAQWANWKQQKLDDGWTWGEKRDTEKKQHPMIVDSYEQVPIATRYKDALFAGIVKALTTEPK